MPHTVGRGAARPLRAQNRQRCERAQRLCSTIWAPRAPQSLCASTGLLASCNTLAVRQQSAREHQGAALETQRRCGASLLQSFCTLKP